MPQTEAAIASGEQLADRCRHEMDDRLQRSRSRSGMALRIPIPAGHADRRSRQPRRVRRDEVAQRGARPPTNSPTCSTRITTPTGSRSCGPARRPTTPTIGAPATAPTIPGTSAALPSKSPSTPTLDDNNALRVGTALGFRFDRILPTFGRVERGLERDDLHMRSMNTALWQVGWGYFLSNMIGAEAGLTPADHRLGAQPLPRPRARLRTASRRCAAARSPTASCR